MRIAADPIRVGISADLKEAILWNDDVDSNFHYQFHPRNVSQRAAWTPSLKVRRRLQNMTIKWES